MFDIENLMPRYYNSKGNLPPARTEAESASRNPAQFNHTILPTWAIVAARILAAITCVCLGLMASAKSTTAQSRVERKQVLLIHSYHNGYRWTDDITRGIRNGLGGDENIDLRIEYLDTKRFPDRMHLPGIYQLFQAKYKDVKIDLVMSTDDDALNFLLAYAGELFPGTPVVFLGANFFDPGRLAEHSQFTGLSEEIDIGGTLELALRLQPNTGRVVFVNDTTITGQIIHNKIQGLAPLYPHLTFEFLEDVTMEAARSQVAGLPPGSIVLLTIFTTDKAGNFFEYDTYTHLVSEASAVPVYGAWDFSLGYGIVGGKLTSGYAEGQRAAQLAQRILNGEKPSDIPVDTTINSFYMFDYEQVRKFDINPATLPLDSVIINQPENLMARYAPYLWLTGIAFFALVVIITIQTAHIQHRRKAEKALQESERRYRTLFDNVPVGLYRSAPDGTILDANREFVQIFGYPNHESLLQINAEALYANTEEREKWKSVQKDANTAFDFVTQGKRYDGSLIWVRNKSQMVSGEQGKPAYYEGSLEDITIQKQAEEELRQKTEEMSTFFDCNLDLLCIADTNGYFYRLNAEWERVLGYLLEELEGINFLSLVHPEDMESTFSAMKALEEQKSVLNFTNRFRCKDGSYRWLEWRSYPSGQLIYAAARDITERKEFELALSNYAERLSTLRQIDQAILASDSREAILQAVMVYIPRLLPFQRMSVVEFDFEKGVFRILSTNSHIRTQFQAGQELPLEAIEELVQVLRTAPAHVVTDIQQASVKTNLDEQLRAEGVQSYLSVPMHVQGKLIGALNFLSTQKGGFTPQHVETAQDVASQLAIAIQQARLNQQVRDYTYELEKRVAERTAQLEAINQELESFSYSVAHDLRAPLRAIDGFSRILEEEHIAAFNTEALTLFRHVRSATQRMNQLVEDLLNLSRLTRGKLQRTRVNLSEIAHEVVTELRQREPNRTVTFLAQEETFAHADARLIRIALENLLGNAWKFTSNTPHAQIEFGANKGDPTVYYVHDNGAGFDMAHSQKLFGAFQRLHTESQFPGTGIGLATVKRIIHRHGGRIWAEAQVEKGATFYFTV